ncbi:unnamed protein product, partial [Pylaiella littoralis]
RNRLFQGLPPPPAAAAAAAAAAAGATEEESVRQLRELLEAAGGSAVALTGAGMSTDSGIPDYRGPNGSYSRGHKPMTHDQFLSSEANRKRYWARSTFGWDSFSRAKPNAGHVALAELEAAGKISGIITQACMLLAFFFAFFNVDGLHQKAGSRNVVDLHGRNDKVECMSCRVESRRNAYQAGLARLNAPWIAKYSEENDSGGGAADASENAKAGGAGGRLRADGDADVEPGDHLGEFIVPACAHCGGILKPTVVFFGDNIPRHRVEETYRIVDDSNLLIAAGSSLQVYSAFRLVKRAADAGKRIVVVNLGGTRAERSGLDIWKAKAGVGNVLPRLL